MLQLSGFADLLCLHMQLHFQVGKKKGSLVFFFFFRVLEFSTFFF